jgi:hypothetical protein
MPATITPAVTVAQQVRWIHNAKSATIANMTNDQHEACRSFVCEHGGDIEGLTVAWRKRFKAAHDAARAAWLIEFKNNRY